MGQPVDVTPAGTSRIAPWIISRDTVAEIDFLGAVFGAVEQPGARIMNGDRVGHAEALREHGADVVVQDLAELLE